jgi:hypothetical protein
MATDRYTESDPVGLEGGVNAYGHVSGNPFVFSGSTVNCCGILRRNSSRYYTLSSS